jgi:hypothetical protein
LQNASDANSASFCFFRFLSGRRASASSHHPFAIAPPLISVGPTYSPITYSPTGLPTPGLWGTSGCPPAFDARLTTAYAVGEHVAAGNLVYECVAFNAAQCRQGGWEPGTGQFWEEAWALLGSCSGTSESCLWVPFTRV